MRGADARKCTAGSEKKVRINILRSELHKAFEQFDGLCVVEIPPAREAGSGQDGDTIRRCLEPGGIAVQDRGLRIRMDRLHIGRDPGVVADGVRELSE